MKIIMKKRQTLVILLATATLFVGCYRGRPSQKPPVHLIPDMDSQPKYDTQEASGFFEDGSTMRLPVEGTVAVGHLDNDSPYYRGKNDNGSFVAKTPVPITLPLLKRGRERFNIYCSPCHSRVGDGNGIVVKRGYLPPPTFHSDRLRDVEDGYIFNVITNGIRNMPSYSHQVPVSDRWAIVAYVRALQRSQNAKLADVPVELKEKITKK